MHGTWEMTSLETWQILKGQWTSGTNYTVNKLSQLDK